MCSCCVASSLHLKGLPGCPLLGVCICLQYACCEVHSCIKHVLAGARTSARLHAYLSLTGVLAIVYVHVVGLPNQQHIRIAKHLEEQQEADVEGDGCCAC